MDNKETVLNYMNTLWNKKDFSVIKEAFSSNVVLNSSLGAQYGTEAMLEIAGTFLSAFPDLQIETTSVIEQNGMVVVQWLAQGTHKGLFKCLEPTGTIAKYTGVTIHRLEEGKIVEYWAYVDMRAWFEELEAISV